MKICIILLVYSHKMHFVIYGKLVQLTTQLLKCYVFGVICVLFAVFRKSQRLFWLSFYDPNTHNITKIDHEDESVRLEKEKKKQERRAKHEAEKEMKMAEKEKNEIERDEQKLLFSLKSVNFDTEIIKKHMRFQLFMFIFRLLTQLYNKNRNMCMEGWYIKNTKKCRTKKAYQCRWVKPPCIISRV